MRELDVKMARRDSRHRAKRIEKAWYDAMRKWRRKVVNWALGLRAKRKSERAEWERRLQREWMR